MEKNVNETKRIFDAIENGNTEMVKQLIANGIDVNTCSEEENLSLLSAAVHSGSLEIIKLLLAHGADAKKADQMGITPFFFAVMSVDEDGGTMAKCMLENGVDINAECEKGFAAIHFFSGVYDNTDGVKFLLDSGADVNAHASFNGMTPLHLAVRKSHIETVKLLLANGADINAVDEDGWTALHFCARFTEDDKEMAQLLLDNGADVNAKTVDKDETALHFAVRNSHIEIVKLLLANGADVNAADAEGATPLHDCARSIEDHTETVQLLIDNGADLQAKSKLGTMPFHDAIIAGNFCLAPLLDYRQNQS